MSRSASAGVVLALVLAGCVAPSDAGVRRVAEEAEDEAKAEPEEGLIPPQFQRGGRAGLEKARAEGRAAMLLFAASW